MYMGCGDGSINEVGNNAFKVNSHTIRRVVGKLKIVLWLRYINGIFYEGRSRQWNDITV